MTYVKYPLYHLILTYFLARYEFSSFEDFYSALCVLSLKKKFIRGNCFTILYWSLPCIKMNQISPPSLTSCPFSTPPQPSRLSQSTEFSFVCHTADSHWLSVLLTVIYMFPCYSLNSSHPLLPTLCPQVFSLCLYLHCCPANTLHQYHLVASLVAQSVNNLPAM